MPCFISATLEEYRSTEVSMNKPLVVEYADYMLDQIEKHGRNKE